MKKVRSSILLAIVVAGSGFAQGNFLTTPETPIDSVLWSGMGPDGTPFSSGQTADSTLGNTTTVTLGTDASLGGLTSVVCAEADPSNCSWSYAPSGYNPGDTLLWFEGLDANQNAFGTGPVSFSLANAVDGMGGYIQATSVGQFTATLTLYDNNASLGSQSYTSDQAGDPLFLGADFATASITSAVIAVTSCGTPGCDVNDFTADALQIYGSSSPSSPTPEPATFALAGILLAGLISAKRYAKGEK